MRDDQKAVKLAQAQADAKKEAEDLAAGWSDDEGDGGAPEPMVIKDTDSMSSLAGQPKGGGLRRGRRGSSGGRGSTTNSNGTYQSTGPVRGQGRGRGRGGVRGRARETTGSRPIDGSETSGAQVCIDLIDLP
jgi:hypothetical protein